MADKQAIRSEKTKKAILSAAEHLFSRRSFDEVTMRDIAKRAGCSHTTIYIYFKNKEALLNQLAKEPLMSVKQTLENILTDQSLEPSRRLAALSKEFIRLALTNRSLYAVFFTAKASRVDEQDPTLEVQRLRNAVFALVGKALQVALGTKVAQDQLLAYTRSYFFLLHGIVASYSTSHESTEELFDRLGPTFDLACACMVQGIQAHMREGTPS